MPTCKLCNKEFKLINKNHLAIHDYDLEKYTAEFGDPNFNPDKPRKTRSSAKSIKDKLDTAEDMTVHKRRILDDLYAEDADLRLPPDSDLLTDTDEDKDKLLLILDNIRLKTKRVDLGIYTSGPDPFADQIVGISMCVPGNWIRSYYIPLNHVDPETEQKRPGQMDSWLVFNTLKAMLEDPEISKTFFDSITSVIFLEAIGIKTRPISWDTKMSMFLLNENLEEAFERTSGLIEHFKKEIEEDLGWTVDIETLKKYAEVFERRHKKDRHPQINIKYAPIKTAACYGNTHAKSITLLRDFQEPYIKSIDRLSNVFELEHKLLPVLIEMRREGIRADRIMAAELAREYRTELEEAHPYLIGKLGNINLASTKQLSEALYDELGLPDLSGGKRSTRKQILEELAELPGIREDMREIVDQLLVMRGHEKLLGTYLEGIDRYINPITQKVHCLFLPWGARTGRFSSADPNLQNLPARDKKKKRIRRVYTADPGEILISCDYGQVEPRITAEIANEEGMIKAFVENRDVYSEMASRVFNKTLEECGDGSQWRTMMKTLWLGILYGMTVPGLATRLMRTKDEAADILNDFFTGNPGIKETMDMYQRQVRQKGYIETLSGRKRRLPDIWSDEWWMRESVKRKILNSVIQGTAADVMKQAMVNVGTDKEIKYLNGRQLVTVHDELIVAAPKETAIEVARLVEINMIRVAEQFDMKRVPFKCDSEIYLDGRWSSQYVLPLKDIKSGKVKESEVNWMV